MSEWGRATYGDPCRQCGYDWSISQEDAATMVLAIPDRYAALLQGRDGSERHPELAWSAGEYVCHVGDNLRIWAERLAGIALGARGPVTPYDENAVARARAYDGIAVVAALWSLGRAAANWSGALGLAAERGVVMTHPERGELSLLDVARTNAHDAHHHEWDIRRSIYPEQGGTE